MTTWSHYFSHLKFFFRWLHYENNKADEDDEHSKSIQDWTTPNFIQIKQKKTKRLSFSEKGTSINNIIKA